MPSYKNRLAHLAKTTSLVSLHIPDSVCSVAAAVSLVCIRVEADSERHALMDGELVDLAIAEHVKEETFGILVFGLHHILLTFPLTLGRTS